jgi:KaiC/GvpD/RAD55 family RecA-like ATPase
MAHSEAIQLALRREDRRLQTRISEVFWCDPTGGYSYKEARLRIARDNGKEHVSWLDELLLGGIVVPASEKCQALSIVITGPPGSGKSTLALEMAYRWAKNEKLTTAYVLAEAFAPWVLENVKSYGWKGGESIFRVASEAQGTIRRTGEGGVILTDLKSLSGVFNQNLRESILGLFGEPPLGVHQSKALDRNLMPEVVVIDSLNTLDRLQRKEIYSRLGRLVSSGIELLVLVGDSPAQEQSTEPWDFVSDMILRLDRSDSGGYLVRTIEIVKARYQSHVWGKHQLKLYEKPTSPNKNDPDANQDARLKLRNHPYVSQGGVFIFPSIHYVLSQYKGMSPSGDSAKGYLWCPLEPLTKLLDRGFPKGHCTGLIGDRGAHKSHLSYLQILSGLLAEPKPRARVSKGDESTLHEKHKALIVSLRDDEGTTRRTLGQIVEQHWRLPDGEKVIEALEEAGDLEITYYPPGFITPEEFFHRLLLCINRLKSGHANSHLSVLFNSLDQLSSRFPLCAQHRIFIPGIIQMLTAENVTSFFVAAKDDESGEDYYGLLSMAELILSFERRSLPKSKYTGYLRSLLPKTISASKKAALSAWHERLDDEMGAVELKVVRFAGGEPAGAHGVLELFKDGSKISAVFGRKGLVFIPSSDRVR